jgi:hypothetical protein
MSNEADRYPPGSWERAYIHEEQQSGPAQVLAQRLQKYWPDPAEAREKPTVIETGVLDTRAGEVHTVTCPCGVALHFKEGGFSRQRCHACRRLVALE